MNEKKIMTLILFLKDKIQKFKKKYKKQIQNIKYRNLVYFKLMLLKKLPIKTLKVIKSLKKNKEILILILMERVISYYDIFQKQ